MLKLVLLLVVIAFVSGNPVPGGCKGNKNNTNSASVTSTTPAATPSDGNGVIQARAQPTTTESTQIDTGVEIVDLTRN